MAAKSRGRHPSTSSTPRRRLAYRLSLVALIAVAAIVLGVSARRDAGSVTAQRAIITLCAARAADATGAPSYQIYQAALVPLRQLVGRLERQDPIRARRLARSLSWLETALDGHAWDVPLSTFADDVMRQVEAVAPALGEDVRRVC